MLFKELYPNILSMSAESFQSFFSSYREKRQRDLDSEVIKVKAKKKSSTGSSTERKIAVTPDQLKLLREIGLI